jgi:nicotinamide-nucleotide amidase
MFSEVQLNLTQQLFQALEKTGRQVSTAESCTGGLIAGLLTDAAGSSAYFERGFVVYSNEAKRELLNVREMSLLEFGAVSKEVAIEMAEGAVKNSLADFAVSVTGIAGPGGARPGKPVGLVYIGLCKKGSEGSAHEFRFDGDRNAVRIQTLEMAITNLTDLVQRS